MADALTAPFVMHGARDAIAGGLVHLEQQVKGIELAVVENLGRVSVHRESSPGTCLSGPERYLRANSTKPDS
jgi:hypothetical protein